MGRRNRRRYRYNRPREGGNFRPSRPPLVKIAPVAVNYEEYTTFLFDQDDFYQTTLDLVLFNFNKPNSALIGNNFQLQKFLAVLESGAISGGIYILDECFSPVAEEQEALLAKIKELDPKAQLIAYTTAKENLENASSYNHVAVKSSRSNEDTLIRVLAEIFQVEFIADNSDPEIDHGG